MREVKSYYSDILNQEFKTSKECLEAEKKFCDKEAEKATHQKEKADFKTKLDAAKYTMNKSIEEYEKLYREYLEKFCKIDSDFSKELSSLFEQLFN